MNAINWAAAKGVRVTDHGNDHRVPSSAIQVDCDTTRASGLVHFASAGNSGPTGLGCPASLVSVNAIGATAPARAGIITVDRTGEAG